MSFFDGNLKLSVTAASGVEAVTKRELLGLGITAGPAHSGRIGFSGSFYDLARANVFLRTANRVYVNLTEFHAESFDELFDNIRAFPWEELLAKNARVIVDAKSAKSKLFALSAIQKIGKKAIVTRLSERYNIVTLPETGAEYHLEISLFEDVVTLALDSSGEGLHKRGYRPIMGLAPMKETLAAAIILLSVWRYDRPLIDCFCGSGTIPVEAALIGTNTAPGLRRKFAFEGFYGVPDLIGKVREEALDLIKRDRNLRISGFDIDQNSIKMAIQHAENAGVSEQIHFQCMDMREVKSHYSHGVIISNLPFGERLLTEKELQPLYRDFGKVYRSLDEWCCYAFTAYPDFEKFFGGKADKTRKLYSSQLECMLYQYLGAPPKRTVDND
jgi:Predicted N6-adenine-specific DNA methylase